jgi:hypothetical protein
LDVRFDRVHRPLDDETHADGGRQVNDDVTALHELGDERFVGDRADVMLEVGPSDQVLDVGEAAGRQVVEDDDVCTVREQPFGQMRADEPGASGDQDFHVRGLKAE